MNLFNADDEINILPYDGEAIYYGHLMPHDMAMDYFSKLLNSVAWQHDEAVIYGKRIITKRKAAWYGDKSYAYTYSKTTKVALPWTAELLTLKKMVEQKTKVNFNSCLLNLYHNGEEGMAWHSDDEKALGNNTTIASLSLGAARRFNFKHKVTKEKADILLDNGSLLVMKGKTQGCWLHSLPKSVKVKSPRINLTFRTIIL